MSAGGFDTRALLTTAQQAAAEAAEHLRTCGDRRVEQESHRDIKLAADKDSERILRDALASTNLPFLGEESGLQGGEREDGLRWIVDPIDGTFNYLRGLPISCVSIGLWRGDAPILGVVHDFNREEVFTGIAGEGAWLNGAPIRTSGIDEKGKASLCTGFPVYRDFSAEALSGFIDEIRGYRKIRMLGSAALMLAYVAAGRADAYKEDSIAVWDIAGGLAIVLGAGGAIELGKSKKVNCYKIFAANGRLSDAP